MARRGIRVVGVASEIGALSDNKRWPRVEEEELIESLCHRFNTDRSEALLAIERAIDEGAAYRKIDKKGGKTFIALVMSEPE